MIWPIGQPPGTLHEQALRSRELWLELLSEARLPYLPTGSLHATYNDDEAALGREFAERAPQLGYEVAWLSKSETLSRTIALREEGLLGALWSPVELTVDPRQVVARIPAFLEERHGVQFLFNTAVQSVDSRVVSTYAREWKANTTIVASGDDFQTLFPNEFCNSGITRCKLQMMRTVPQPGGWQLGPSLAFGLSFAHYPTFQICESLPALRWRYLADLPDLVNAGIHVMVSQTAQGELTLGDSHEYGLQVNIFDKQEINRLIMDFATEYLRVPALTLAQTWHGVYAKHPEKPYFIFEPAQNVRLVVVTSGIGMTMSLGLAEQVLREMGVLA
jgi:D-hydroxyproline dehydrogenase subunit beta